MALPYDTLTALSEVKTNPDATPMSMPPSFYKDGNVLAMEMDDVFINGWVCVGRADEVPEVGDYYALDILDEPIIVTRNKDEEVVVLSNVCRHRGSQLLTGRGNRKRITCPYHRWSYDGNGKLLSAPLVDQTEGFDKSRCNLPKFNTHLPVRKKLSSRRIKIC